MGALPPGGAMIAVDFGVEQAEALVADEPGCAIAAVNGPRSVTISGAADAVARAHAAVRGQGGRAVNLTVSHAFHSPLMEPMVAEFRREMSGLAPGPAEFRLFSTVLGREVEGHEMDTDYWATQICSPVRFFDAVQAAVSAASADYVAEAGPRSTLLALARQCGLPPQTRSLALCAGPDSDGTELLGVAATLLRDGYSPDLSPLYGRPGRPAAPDSAVRLRHLQSVLVRRRGRRRAADGPAGGGHTNRRARTSGAGTGRHRERGTGCDRRSRRLFSRPACPVRPAQ